MCGTGFKMDYANSQCHSVWVFYYFFLAIEAASETPQYSEGHGISNALLPGAQLSYIINGLNV